MHICQRLSDPIISQLSHLSFHGEKMINTGNLPLTKYSISIQTCSVLTQEWNQKIKSTMRSLTWHAHIQFFMNILI